MNARRARPLTVLALFAAAVSACTAGPFAACPSPSTRPAASAEHRLAAERVVDRFHELYDRDLIATIPTELMSLSIAEQRERTKYLTALRATFGPTTRTDPGGWDVVTRNDGTTLELWYRTDFEKGLGGETETFVFAVGGGAATLLHYYVWSRKFFEY